MNLLTGSKGKIYPPAWNKRYICFGFSAFNPWLRGQWGPTRIKMKHWDFCHWNEGVCASYGDEGLADGGEDVGSERVQQQLVFGEDGEQQRAGVFWAEVLQQLQEARAAIVNTQGSKVKHRRDGKGNLVRLDKAATHLSGSGEETGWQSSRLSYGESCEHTQLASVHTRTHTHTHHLLKN